MNYYFSAPESSLPVAKQFMLEQEGMHYLMTFAHSLKQWKNFAEKGKCMMMDSGAFSAWNSGKIIDREKYLKCIQSLPDEVYKINLDVIPKTGSTPEEKELACKQSFENFLYLNKYVKNVLPVHHYGDDISWIKKMLDYTDYVCISPANDTHETIKKRYLDYIFSEIPLQTKTHCLGYTSKDGLRKYPFYSVDSISYKTTQMRGMVIMCREDGEMVNLELGEYAKIINKVFSTHIPMKDQREIVQLGAIETIKAFQKYFKSISKF